MKSGTSKSRCSKASRGRVVRAAICRVLYYCSTNPDKFPINTVPSKAPYRHFITNVLTNNPPSRQRIPMKESLFDAPLPKSPTSSSTASHFSPFPLARERVPVISAHPFGIVVGFLIAPLAFGRGLDSDDRVIDGVTNKFFGKLAREL